jgi:hypothetical protein
MFAQVVLGLSPSAGKVPEVSNVPALDLRKKGMRKIRREQ